MATNVGAMSVAEMRMQDGQLICIALYLLGLCNFATGYSAN